MGDNYYGRNREGWVPLVKPTPVPEQKPEEAPVVGPSEPAAQSEESEQGIPSVADPPPVSVPAEVRPALRRMKRGRADVRE